MGTTWLGWGGLLALGLGLSPAVHAIDGNFRFGTGPDGYTSYAFNGGSSVFDTDVDWSLDLQSDYVDGDLTARSFGARLDWTPLDWLSGHYRRGVADADLLNITSNAFGLSVNVGRLWSDRFETRLDLAYEIADYRNLQRRVRRGGRIVVQTLEIPTQESISIGLTQDVLDSLSVFGFHDFYEYSEDPQALARVLLRLRRRPVNAIYSLTSFPDSATSVGFSWSPTDRLGADFTYGIIDTVIDQRTEEYALDLHFDVNDNLSLGAGVSFSKSDAIIGPRGATLLDGSEGTYYSLSLGFYY